MRRVRCQGVVIKENRILVLRQYNSRTKEEYWLLPGGGKEVDETLEEGVIRELKEETNLDINVLDLMEDDFEPGVDGYKTYKTFICEPLNIKDIRAGKENSGVTFILELVWVDINNEKDWNQYLLKDQFYPSMKTIQKTLIDKKFLKIHESS
ncbi:MAG: NUDIX hydrolase [Clostridiales bacterium]|nr:NUDIX hydrolase [Clostridiales bacterium]